MKQPSNHVTEASRGEYGQEIAEKVQERIDWVVSQTTGSRILEIGCNQGEISFLLGREGKTVLGIDKNGEAIRDARKVLEEETGQTQKKVIFRQMDFLEDQLEETEFDTVILSEVLEQFQSVRPMLRAACEKVKEGGKAIITVPFGVNEYEDQQKTFYLQEIYQEVKQFFKIDDIAFIGDSIGLVTTKSASKNRGPIPQRYILRLEEAFYRLEKEWIEKRVTQEEVIRQLKQEKERLQADLLAAEASAEEQTPDPVSGNGEENTASQLLSQQQAEHERLRQEKKELMELNEELRNELKESTKLNIYWEKELSRLREDFRRLDEKWAKKFLALKKQYQAIFRGYKLYFKRVKNVREKK